MIESDLALYTKYTVYSFQNLPSNLYNSGTKFV